MYSNGLTLNASTYRTLFSSASGQLAVPVKPNAVIYSQFDHIHGISSGSGESGVPVNKIRILNTLINQLMTMKKDSVSSQDFEGMDEQKKDALIQQYQQQVKDTIAASQLTGYGTAGIMPEAGAVFTISA